MEVSVEDSFPPTWHMRCLNCLRYFRTTEDLSEKDETSAECPHCKTKLQGFSSFRTVYNKFFHHNENVAYDSQSTPLLPRNA